MFLFMRNGLIAFLFLGVTLKDKAEASGIPAVISDTIPAVLKGDFVDDYDIQYSLNDSLFLMHPKAKYHIVRWNTTEQYFIARNDTANVSEKDLYTRVDYMLFKEMEPWLWGFCLTVYDAKTAEQAEAKAAADRLNPKIGCNGYPFSRMKRK